MPTHRKANLVLAFDAFGTLFAPRAPVARQYADVARGYGIEAGEGEVGSTFGKAFNKERLQSPNYGKGVGMGPTAWWGRVIKATFEPFLSKGQEVPQPMIDALLHRFASSDGYHRYDDVLQTFEHLRKIRQAACLSQDQAYPWPYKRTVVGVITNSDDRVPGILRSLGIAVAEDGGQSRLKGVGDSDKTVDVDFVVMSYDVGFAKPDRRIFDAAVQLLENKGPGGAAEAAEDDWDKVYVGDEIERDMHAASDAGWNAVLIDRSNQFKNADIPLDIGRAADDGGELQRKSQNSDRFRVIHDLRALRNLGAVDTAPVLKL